MRKSGPLVSIIIVVKNDRGVGNTLEAIEKQKTGPGWSFETIVVDSSSPERLRDIKDNYPKTHWIQYPVSTMRTTPQQRNRGIASACGKYIVFIDANCIPIDGWLRAIVLTLNEGKDIVCGPVRDQNPDNLVHYDQEKPGGRYIDDCTTINVGFRREIVEKIGGFDTSFLFGQDIDFFWRARDAGYRIYYNSDVAIAHDWGKSSEQLRRAFEYGKARAHLYRKHWRKRWMQLLKEPHVWIYPVFIIGLPLTFILPFYPLLLGIPIVKNLRQNPIGLVLHHLSYGLGVLYGAIKSWPKGTMEVA